MSRTWLIVVLFVVSWPISGAIDALLGATEELFPPTYLPHMLTISILSFAWCRVDVEANAFAMPRGSRILCAIAPPLGVPIHLYRTRPARRATLATLKGAGIFALAFFSYDAAVYAVQALVA